MMAATLSSVLPKLQQLISTLPSPPPCLRLDQQNLPLLHEDRHSAAATTVSAAVSEVIAALIKFMARDLPPALTVLLAAGAPPFELLLILDVAPRHQNLYSVRLNPFFKFVPKLRRNLQFTATSPSQRCLYRGDSPSTGGDCVFFNCENTAPSMMFLSS
jgi:hypothetical protein